MQKIQKKPECDRLIHAAHRLAKISRHDPLKLFQLLYLLDIRYFREKGKSCTGEHYYAMADGPAPGTLRPLLVMRDLDLSAAIGVLTSSDPAASWSFDPKPFCHGSLAMLDALESAYANLHSRDISLDDDNAWWRVYNNSRGVGAIIPYELTIGRSHLGYEPASATQSNFFAHFRLSNLGLNDQLILGKP